MMKLVARFTTLSVLLTGLNASANDYPYSATVGAHTSREDCVRDLVGEVIRRSQYQQKIRVTGVSSNRFSRMLNQYNLTGTNGEGSPVEGFALVSFQPAQNSLTCFFTNRNLLNASDKRLLLTTERTRFGMYHPRYFILELTESGFRFEANR